MRRLAKKEESKGPNTGKGSRVSYKENVLEQENEEHQRKSKLYVVHSVTENKNK